MKLKSITLILSISLIISVIFIAPTSSWAFWIKYHKDITSSGLPFLREEVRRQIVDGNIGQDSTAAFNVGGPAWDAKNHFDACKLSESSSNIQGKYYSAMRQTSNNHPFDAAWTFGQLLHPVQDFYSHSNWPEISHSIWASTDKLNIVDSGLGIWKPINSWQVLKGKVVPIQEPVKSGWSVQRISPQSGYFSDPLPEVKDPQGNKYVGLFTHGREAYRLGDDCPDAVEGWNHDQLNKDGDTRRKYAGQLYKESQTRAVQLAVDQTAHEWCRYLNLLKSNPTYGYQAVSIPMALWVDKNASPHPAGTPCQLGDVGDKSVIVSISNVKVLNDLDDGNNPGDLTLAFVLYKGDLSRSSRTEVGPIEVESGNNWPISKLPQSLTMCLKPSDTLVATVQGWDDENKKTNKYYGKFNNKIIGYTTEDGQTYSFLEADSDQTLRGVTYVASGPGFGQGQHTITSANIEVTLQISPGSRCSAEASQVLISDIDSDRVLDISDNCPTVPNYDQKDTDRDGKGNACDPDDDNDGVIDSQDNCITIHNINQSDMDKDGRGDACDADADGDGIPDRSQRFPEREQTVD